MPRYGTAKAGGIGAAFSVLLTTTQMPTATAWVPAVDAADAIGGAVSSDSFTADPPFADADTNHRHPADPTFAAAGNDRGFSAVDLGGATHHGRTDQGDCA